MSRNQDDKSCKKLFLYFLTFLEFDGKSMETETTTWSEFPNGGKVFVKQIVVSEEIHKSKKAGQWESQSGIRVGKLTTWVRSFEIEILQQSSPGWSVPPE